MRPSSPAAPRGRADRLPRPLLIAAFCLLWSSAFAVAKLGFEDCPPLLLLTIRYLLAGSLIVGTAVLGRAEWRLGWRDLAALAALGIVNNAVYLGLNYVGMLSVSAGLAALIISANPVLTALMAAFLLGEPMTRRKAAGLLLGVAGVGFIVQHRIVVGADQLVGIAFVLGALVAMVGGTILFKLVAPQGRLWIGNGIQNLAGGLALAPIAFALEGIDGIVPGWRLVGVVAYLALLVSVFGFLLWFHLLTVSGATAASAYHFLMPPLGLFFGWLILNERIALFDLLGIVPVVLGIYLVTRSGRSPPTTAASGVGATPGSEPGARINRA